MTELPKVCFEMMKTTSDDDAILHSEDMEEFI
jgi:hypothetical protein